MNVVTLLITHAKPSLLEQPRERGFHHPADRAEAAGATAAVTSNHWAEDG